MQNISKLCSRNILLSLIIEYGVRIYQGLLQISEITQSAIYKPVYKFISYYLFKVIGQSH